MKNIKNALFNILKFLWIFSIDILISVCILVFKFSLQKYFFGINVSLTIKLLFAYIKLLILRVVVCEERWAGLGALCWAGEDSNLFHGF